MAWTLTDTWNSAFNIAPADSQARSLGATRIRETRLATHERLGREHFLAGNSYDGLHKEGSAIPHYAASAPTLHADGETALGSDAYSNGKLWIYSDNDVLYHWKASAFVATVVAQLAQATSLGSTTRKAWAATYGAIDFGYGSLYGTLSTGDVMGLVANGYFDVTNSRWEFKGAGYGTKLSIDGSEHKLFFSTSATGVADGAITWLDDLTLTGSYGSTSNAVRLKLAGAAAAASDRDAYIEWSSDSWLFWDESASELQILTPSGGFLKITNLEATSTMTGYKYAVFNTTTKRLAYFSS